MERFYNRFIITTLCFTALFTSPSFAASDLEGGVKDLAEQISKNMTTGNKKKVAIVDFSDLDGNVAALGQFLAEELITQLFMISPGQFEVVERRQLLKLEKELLLSQTGFIEEKSIKQMGQVLGVDAIVTGSITDLGNTVKVNARLIGVESAKVFAVASTNIPKVGTVAELISKAAASTPVMAPASSQGTAQPSVSPSENNQQSKKVGQMVITVRQIQVLNGKVVVALEIANQSDNESRLAVDYGDRPALTDEKGNLFEYLGGIEYSNMGGSIGLNAQTLSPKSNNDGVLNFRPKNFNTTLNDIGSSFGVSIKFVIYDAKNKTTSNYKVSFFDIKAQRPR